MLPNRPLLRRALTLALLLVSQGVVVVTASSPARAANAVFAPVADAAVYADQAAANFGSADRLVADTSPTAQSFLRFEVTGVAAPPTAVRLRLWVTNSSYNGPKVRRVTSAWEENAVTWNTRPSVGTEVVADIGSVAAGQWLEYDVSALVTGDGVVDLALVGDSSDGTDFASRNDGVAANRPQLVVDTAGSEPPPPPDGPSVFGPVADVAVYSDQAGVNFGSATRLVADGSPATQSFLRFEVTGLETPATARLRLWVTNPSTNGPEVRRITSSWDERSVTWDTRPVLGTVVVADIGSVSAGQWLEYDVSALVTANGTVEMALVGDSTDGTDFASREDGNASNRPRLVVGTAGSVPPPPPPPPGDAFSFGLVGDTGYDGASVTRFLNVRTEMNQAGLAFTGHIGDIKNGADPCVDSVYTTNRDRFNGFNHPLVYTPGDNEWRDCSDRNGRLAFLRQAFFPTSDTQGRPSMTVMRQSAQFPENAMWHAGPITFVTVHTVGSDNNDGSSEFGPRNDANITWLEAAFKIAAARGSTGMVILSHANPGFPPDAGSLASRTGFKSYLEKLVAEVQAWGKPVLYVHGDTHKFRIDHPTVLGVSLPNFTRVEVFGPSYERWVRVDYDPANPALFRITGR